MAAPKHWGYTRDQPIGDELLVSWADGDLTAGVGKELEERLLADAEERAMVAAYARDCARSAEASGRRDRLIAPRGALLEQCERLAGDEAVGGPAQRSPLPSARTLLSIGLGGLITLSLIAWMLREFA
jgi:hypothetical protein